MDIGTLFKGLNLNSIHNYLLYVSGLILILSFPFNFVDIDNNLVRIVCIFVIVGTIFNKILDNIYGANNLFIYENHTQSSKDMALYYKKVHLLTNINFIIQICVWAFIIVFLLIRY